MIESLYIIDSSGLCLYSAPFAAKERYDPDLISGFMMAQQKAFKHFFSESTKLLTLQKKQILIQNIDLKDRNVLIAIAHEIGNQKEEKLSRAIIEGIAAGLRSRKDRIFRELISVVTETVRREFDDIVEKTLKGIPCLFYVKGFLAQKPHCDRTDSPTEGRPCDFNYAVKQCDRYDSRKA